MRTTLFALLPLALAACDRKPAPPPAPQPPSAFQKQIAALDTGQRNAVFIRAIRDAGFDCQGVTQSEAKPDAGGQPLWHATCQGGATYGVLIGRDGTATVVGAR